MKKSSDSAASHALRFQKRLWAWLMVLWCVGLLIAPAFSQVPAVDERAERYLDGYMMNNEGERLEKAGQAEEALRKFREAAVVFDSLAQHHPQWEANMIGMRQRKVQDSIQRVQGVMERSPSAVPPPPTNLPGGTSSVAGAGALEVLTTPQSKSPPEVGSWGAGGAAPGLPAAGEVPSLGAFLQQYEQQVKEKMAGLQQKNLEMEGALRKWDEWYRWASKEIQGARTEKESLMGRTAEMEKRVQQMQREVEAGRNSQGQLDTLLKEKAALLALEKQNMQRLEAAEQAAAEAAQKVTATSAELAALSQERDKLKAERDASLKERDSAMAAETKLTAEIVELKRQRPDEVSLKKLTAENERLKGELEVAAQQIVTLQDRVTSRDEEIASLKNELGTIQSQLATLRKENTAYQTQVSELTAQLKEVQMNMASKAGGEAENESEMLREVILRQLRNQARQQQAKSLVIAELKKLEGASAELLAQVRELDEGRLTLTEEEEALFTDPQAQELLRSGSGAVQATLIASGSGPIPPQMPSDAGKSPEETAPASESGSGISKFLNEGREALAEKNFADAVTAFSEALRADPKNTDALLGLGDAHQRAGQFADAEVALKKCLSYAPENATAYHALGLTYFRGGRLNEAMEAFEKSIERDAKQALAHHYLGIIASRLKQLPRAEKEFRTALAVNPEFGEAHFNLAVLYVSWNPQQLDKARLEYQSAIQKGVVPDENLEKMLQ